MNHFHTDSKSNYITLFSSSPEQTEELGQIVGRVLPTNAKVALIGDLATGKTCFVKGVVKEICGNLWVHSPTFTLINQYGNPPKVLHLDCYRIYDEREVIDMGAEEWLSDNSICLIEWADKIINIIPLDIMYIYFFHSGNNKRKIEIHYSNTEFLEKLLNSIPTYYFEDKEV